ncbi:uncharacterized protein CTRU02_200489 [Colletotrichum truncatum]|uniref:Uncharacterized protein n=1 Tax=Colletotrichum truncatum TaxID=5467 RepID=A0ACC3ZFD1_COLTU|nr:uncharacterized protein CTRU02_00250 [Colletotrichum truncatum]KAF6801501.1 hypothetical protein CTRU02_00250 [Colletotrichum truncatum]
MRFDIVILLAALQLASAELILKRCGQTWPGNWVSNCNQKDRDGCFALCSGKCRTGNYRAMAKPNQDCDCYCA